MYFSVFIASRPDPGAGAGGGIFGGERTARGQQSARGLASSTALAEAAPPILDNQPNLANCPG